MPDAGPLPSRPLLLVHLQLLQLQPWFAQRRAERPLRRRGRARNCRFRTRRAGRYAFLLRREPRATRFFGGGTPSLLDPSEIRRLIAACRDAFSLANDAEITLETNPET